MAETVRDRRKSTEITINRHNRKKKVPAIPIVLGKRDSFVCPFCQREFSREKTITSHLCEQRRRFDQKDSKFARYGYEAFVEIQCKFFGKQSKKSEEDFRKSDFYLACVRWGHFVLDIHVLDVKQYLSWLLIKNIPIDQWDKDEIYDFWLQYYVFVESAWDAFERSITKMTVWGKETGKPYEKYFSEAGDARILTDVRKGWISGWAVFNCKSGREWLNNLAQGDLELVWLWLDPSRWKIQFAKFPDEVEKISAICKEAAL